MVYPDNFGLIQEALERSLKEHGVILAEYAVKFPASRAEELFMTFSPGRDGGSAIVRFWAVVRNRVVPVPPEVVFDDKTYHEGWGWEEAWEESFHENDHQEENEENLYI